MPLYCRSRWFDPAAHRTGLPEDLAALVEKLTDSSVTLTLVNLNQLEERSVVVQAGGYGEHQFQTATAGGREMSVAASSLKIHLAPGSGGTMIFRKKRFVHPPSLAFPWHENR